VGVEYLDWPQHRVHHKHTSSGLARKPVGSLQVKRRAIKRIRLYVCGNDRKSREYSKSLADCTAGTRWVRRQSSTSSDATYPWNNLTNGRWFDKDDRIISKSLETNSSCRQTMSYGAVDRKLAMALILWTLFFETYFKPLPVVNCWSQLPAHDSRNSPAVEAENSNMIRIRH